jgi:hypothetical protein
MKRKLYATELLKKIVTEKELRILEVAWDDELSAEEKIDLILEEDTECSNSK